MNRKNTTPVACGHADVRIGCKECEPPTPNAMMGALEECDKLAEAGLCCMSFSSAREFLKDIRREVRKLGLQGGLTEFEK